MDGDSWLSWLFIAILFGCAAYFALAEVSTTSVSKIRLKARAEYGDWKAEKALYVQDHFDLALSAILIGTNIVHISTATLTTILVARTWGTGWVALGTVVCTIAIFFAGEMLPKSIGKRYSERCAVGVAPSLCFFIRIFAPFAKALSVTGDFFTGLFRGEPEVSVTEDELHDIIEIMTDEGGLPEERGELVQSALEFDSITAGRIFTPRKEIKALDIHTEGAAVLDFIRQTKKSRIPVFDGDLDHVIGILQIRKYIRAYLQSGRKPELGAFLDAPYFVGDSASADELLEEMSRRKLSMAIVQNRRGRTLGIVTVEDLLEEIVGEIWDEDDIAGGDTEA